MTTINKISNQIMGYFDGSLESFGYISPSVNEISNPDESYMGTLNIQFKGYPVDDDEKGETYCRESDAFEQAVLNYINDMLQKAYYPNTGYQLEKLNDNHHFMANHEGDTIQVHFNDESLFIIVTFTGQY